MIVREGWLLKRGQHIKNWRARYFVLMDDGSLLGFRQKPPSGQYRDPTNNFTVRGCHIVKVESEAHFKLSSNARKDICLRGDLFYDIDVSLKTNVYLNMLNELTLFV